MFPIVLPTPGPFLRRRPIKKFVLILPLTVLCLAALVAVAACSGDDDDNGGGDTLTAEAYFSRFADIGNGAQDDVQAIPNDTDAVDALHQVADIFNGAADDLDAVKEPGDVSSVHSDMVDATRDLAMAFDDLADSAGTDQEEAMGKAWEDALTAWGEACSAVVDEGETQGFTVDVDCSVGS